MKILLSCLLFFYSFNSIAQNNIVEKYFDSSWQSCSVEKARYYTKFEKDNALYHTTSYYLPSKKLFGISTFTDTAFSKSIGLMRRYYENGNTKDSTFFADDGTESMSWHYYENGKLWVHQYLDKKNKEKIEAFDTHGNTIDDFIYEQDAEFEGGSKAWIKYLTKNVKKDFDFKTKSKQPETFKVVVQFIVNKSGTITEVKVYQSSGKTEIDNDAINVVKNSPEWRPAIMMNKPVNAYRRQPLTYVIAN